MFQPDLIGSVGAADRNPGGEILGGFFVSFARFSIELFLFGLNYLHFLDNYTNFSPFGTCSHDSIVCTVADTRGTISISVLQNSLLPSPQLLSCRRCTEHSPGSSAMEHTTRLPTTRNLVWFYLVNVSLSLSTDCFMKSTQAIDPSVLS